MRRQTNRRMLTQSRKPDLAVEWACSAWKSPDLSIPVDVHRVRKKLKLHIRYQDLGIGNGYLMQTPKRIYIIVNSRHKLERQQWTIAHEIGEHCLVRQRMRSGMPCISGQLKERLCDHFAANLLMPADLVKRAAKELYHSQTNDKTDVLASRFCVS